MKVMKKLGRQAEEFDSKSISGLLRSAPDLESYMGHIKSLFKSVTTGTLSLVLCWGADSKLTEYREDYNDLTSRRC